MTSLPSASCVIEVMAPPLTMDEQQPDLVVELIGLFFEFRELVVYLVDPFPQGGVVEVVAASAAEKKSRCQK